MKQILYFYEASASLLANKIKNFKIKDLKSRKAKRLYSKKKSYRNYLMDLKI